MVGERISPVFATLHNTITGASLNGRFKLDKTKIASMEKVKKAKAKPKETAKPKTTSKVAKSRSSSKSPTKKVSPVYCIYFSPQYII